MAIYHASTTSLSRRSGRSAVAAAYRTATRLVDTRLDKVYDYRRKGGVASSNLVLPWDEWTVDREALWNAAETAEKHKDARTAREWTVALPDELSPENRRTLALSFSRELATRYQVAVDVAIHEPSPQGDERNHHAHLLLTTREVSWQDGEIVLGKKASMEWRDQQRREQGLGSCADEITYLRERWAAQANDALERAGQEVRIDHRTLEAQGIDRVPQIHLGPHVTAMERRGESTSRARTWLGSRGWRRANGGSDRLKGGSDMLDLLRK